MIHRKTDLCPLCGGPKKEGKTTFTVDYKDSIIVIRDVPATVCELCGHEWISDDISAGLEAIINDAKKKKPYVEIMQYKKVA